MFIYSFMLLCTLFITTVPLKSMDAVKQMEIEETAWTKLFEHEIQKSKLIDKNGALHPLLSQEGMDQLFNIACDVKDAIECLAPNKLYQVFSLGQSAAWLIHMMRLIDDSNRTSNTRYGHIAFSGNFFDYYTKKKVLKRTIKPSSKQKKQYGAYLNSLNLKPDISCWHTFIIEFPCYTRGVLSFDEVAKPYLPAQMNYLISPPLIAMLPERSYVLETIDHETAHGFLAELRNSDRFDDRRVLNFPIEQWGVEDPLQFKLSDSAHLLEKIMALYVESEC